jgi:all-trans-retinol dehydrogenase (NAD+)
MMSSPRSTSVPGLIKGAILLPFKLTSYVALEPIATGLLLFTLTKAPREVRDVALRALQRAGITASNLNNITTPLKYLLAAGILRRLHHALNRFAENYYHLRPQGELWKFGDEKLSELIMITGGCSGFGALMTKGFVGKARVVIIDVQDQPDDLKRERDCPSTMEFTDGDTVPGVSFYRCDITDRLAIQKMAATIREEHGDPSVLINNAGIGNWLQSNALQILTMLQEQMRRC